MSKRDEILPLFPAKIRERLSAADIDFKTLREIRLRVNQPLMLRTGSHEECQLLKPHVDPREKIHLQMPYEGSRGGSHSSKLCAGSRGGACYLPYRVTAQDVRDTVELISRHSLYAFEEDVKRGFLTVPGGHRVGIAGRVVMEGGKVAVLRNISFLNIRVSHEVRGCAEEFFPYIIRSGEPGDRGSDGQEFPGIRGSDSPVDDIFHTLILSGPGGGKTTLLRDLVRLLSYGGKNVSVIDERSEIAACYQGIPENDLGPRTDVLDGCPKAIGLRMALRSLAPDILAVDELGGSKDLEALSEVTACGCRVIATMHANGLKDLPAKSFFREAWEQKTFERFLVRVPGVPVGHRDAWRAADAEGRWIS